MVSGFHTSIDTALVASARRGCPRAREAIYRQYGQAVFTLARRMLAETAAAEDVLQDCFIKVFEKLPACREEASLGFWIRRIAVNECLMHRRAHWQSHRDSLDGMHDGHMEAAGRTEDGQDLARLLDRLPPEDRMIMWLKEVEGYSHAEIADQFGQSVSYSKSRLSRAHQRLREMLSEEVAQCTQQPVN